jgi:hypothetical protein
LTDNSFTSIIKICNTTKTLEGKVTKMKVNQKAMYLMLKQQAKSLQNQISPAANVEQVNEVPENFNQNGWDSTIEKVEQMLEKMKQLRDVKGNRLTPPFYRSIYNRALIANNEIEKLKETLSLPVDTSIDYEAECVKLNAEIYTLNIQVAEKAAAEAAAKAEAEAAEAARLTAEAQAAKQLVKSK